MTVPTFLDLEPELGDLERAAAVVLPVAFERTVSYGHGTAHGPRAILEASTQVETYDETLDGEPCAMGIATLPVLTPAQTELEAAIAEIEAAALPQLAAGRFLITLGGEHTVTLGPVRALRHLTHSSGEESSGEKTFGVLQFDAHADLRDRYQGTPWSHACVMKRIVDLGVPTAAVGLRSLSPPEAALIRERRIPVIWGHQLDDAERRFDALLEALPETVYVTFDLDYLDPAILPATGTPEPGGGAWYPTLRLLEHVFARKRVLAMDVVELAPIAGHPASDFLAAKLIYKCLGYWHRHRRGAARLRGLP